MGNTLIKIDDGRKELYQWDTRRSVIYEGKCEMFHFSNQILGRSLDVVAEYNGKSSIALIPDELLQKSGILNVYVYAGEQQNGYTKISTTFSVISRNKPSDYVFTPTEQKTLEELDNKIGELNDLKTADKSNIVNAVNELHDKSGTGGTTDHNKLLNRELPNQHPIGAITDLESQLSSKLNESKLPEAINTALKQAKDSGEFKGDKGDPGINGTNGTNGKDGTNGTDGKDGEDGGYYTPSVAQPDSNHIEIGFSGSKADMPDVGATSVELPGGDAIKKAFVTVPASETVPVNENQLVVVVGEEVPETAKINDTAISSDATWSSNKIKSEIPNIDSTLTQANQAADAKVTGEKIKDALADAKSYTDSKCADSKLYGVKFTGSASAGERIYDARGMVARASTDTEHEQNDFDNVMPWAAMRRCNTEFIEGERIPTVFEGEPGYDNKNKDVFVYVPLFYYFRSNDDNTHIISMSPRPGCRAPYKFHKKDGTLRGFVFLPAYTAGLVDGVPVSRSGLYPHIDSLTGWMNLCKQKHSGSLDEDLWIEGMADDEIKNILLDIEFANRDHQTVMMGALNMRYTSDTVITGGTDKFTVTPEIAMNYAVGQAIAIGTADKGNQKADNATITGINTDTGEITFKPVSGSVTVDAGNFISSRPWKSGVCDNVQGSCGSPVDNTNGRFPCVYRGIENPYGNQYRFRWDFLKNDDQPYVLDDPNNYDGSLNEHYTALGYKVPTTGGYATEIGFDEKFPHARVTSAIGGGSRTYFADYYYYVAGLRVLRVGGYVYNGRDAGARFYYVDYSPSKVSWSTGVALSPA